jgi:hypothetical protein
VILLCSSHHVEHNGENIIYNGYRMSLINNFFSFILFNSDMAMIRLLRWTAYMRRELTQMVSYI